ncbi:MAG: hypothetical protein AB1758_23495 [Candidatus Eremiobacterota bacterium]
MLRKRLPDLLILLAIVALVPVLLGRLRAPEPPPEKPAADGYSIQGVVPGMSLDEARRWLGGPGTETRNPLGDVCWAYPDQVSLFPTRDARVYCVYGTRLQRNGSVVLEPGTDREAVHRVLGPPADPSGCSPHRPPDYELYKPGGMVLELTYTGDQVSLFALMQPR